MSSLHPGHVCFLAHNLSPPKEVFLPEKALDSSLLTINYAAGYTDDMVNSAIPGNLIFNDLSYADTPLVDCSATPYHPPIPPLIKADGVDEGDVNVLLGSITDLPFPTTFKTLLGSAMALWAVLAPDAQTINSFGLDTAIDGFMDFLSPPCLPTTVSPVQLPIKISPTPQYSDPLLPSPLPCDEDTVMASSDSPALPSSHIYTPMPHPLEKGKM